MLIHRTTTGLTPVGANEPDLSYRLNIVAPSVVDVVKHAGGWVFDRVMAGWHVVVFVGDVADDRPLRILGANSPSFQNAVSSNFQCELPQSIAVPAELFESDSRVRNWVLNSLEHGRTQVVLWGRSCPPELSDQVDSVQHRLTTAAQAFKAQALLAACVADMEVGETEVFQAGAVRRPMVARDLFAVHTDGVLGEFETGWCRIIELKTASAVT